MTKLRKILDDAVRDGFKKALDISEGNSRAAGRAGRRDSLPGETSSPRPVPRNTPAPLSLDLDSLGERP